MIADPIADKALTGSALIGLSALGLGPWWVTVVILGREFGITLMRFWDLHDRITPASLGGKAKTVAQIAAIGLYLLPLAALLGAPVVIDVVRWALLPLAVTLTIVTGLDHVLRTLRIRL